MQLGLSLTHNRTRLDRGSAHCLNLLLAEQLTRDGFSVTMPVADELMQTLQFVIPTQSKRRRPTRRAVLSWQDPDPSVAKGSKTQPNQKDSLNLDLQISQAESVFGQTLPEVITQRVKVRFTPAGRVNMELPPAFKDFLEKESAALSLQDLPVVSKIYGAWAYLDKGRAWGLKMSDRMVLRNFDAGEAASSGGAKIKGHVVGFFGAASKIRSPKGYLIHEGAILYIRYGLDQLTLGDRFDFDPRNFPTKWPPEPAKSP